MSKTDVDLVDLLGKGKVRRTYKPAEALVLPYCHVGIECEVEGVTGGPRSLNGAASSKELQPFWNFVEDGSLRQGTELVSEALFGEDILSALTVLEQWANKKSANIKLTDRCSTHIHVDATDLRVSQLLSLCMIYLTFERTLFKISGNRINNNYCVPLYNCSSALSRLGMLVDVDGKLDPKQVKTSLSMFTQDIRYCAFNLSAIWKHGTIEFRHMAPTLDMARLLTWINLLLSLKKTALELPPDDYPEFASAHGYETFTHQVFGDLSPMLIGSDNFFNDIVLGLRTAQELYRKTRLINTFNDFLLPYYPEKKVNAGNVDASGLTAGEIDHMYNVLRTTVRHDENPSDRFWSLCEHQARIELNLSVLTPLREFAGEAQLHITNRRGQIYDALWPSMQLRLIADGVITDPLDEDMEFDDDPNEGEEEDNDGPFDLREPIQEGGLVGRGATFFQVLDTIPVGDIVAAGVAGGGGGGGTNAQPIPPEVAGGGLRDLDTARFEFRTAHARLLTEEERRNREAAIARAAQRFVVEPVEAHIQAPFWTRPDVNEDEDNQT